MKAFLVFSLFALLASSFATAAIVEHSFIVRDFNVTRLCNTQIITAVNGMVPGPTIGVRENDTLVVHVFNGSPHNITLHWHGVFQISSQWADGPEYITQCPIRPGQWYTYKFTIIGQEGTLWWHAHAAFLRTYAYGALIIRPRIGCLYPFPKPYKEVPILLGEWWKSDINRIFDEIQVTGDLVPISDAFTINGMPGDLYNCPQDPTFKLKVKQGKTYLLRIINANLINQMFFKLANHKFTVVAVDAGYTTPYVTDVVVIAPGQTTDVLLTADQPVGSYYMASSAYVTTVVIAFDNTTTRGLVVYKGASRASPPLMPALPAFNDTTTAHRFYTNLTGLAGGPQWVDCPLQVDEHMFITLGLNLDFCSNNATCAGPLGFRFSSSMNNESFVTPSNKGLSMLEAFFRNKPEEVYTRDFPDFPPVFFDFVSPNISFDLSKIFAPKSTKVKTLKFDSTVEIVLQNTAFLGIENHPMHIHGFDFYVLAQGFGVFNAMRDSGKFNVVNPQRRNTIAVPTGGWAVIRFKANNPGIWFMHCHIDAHLPWGLATAFEVENGPTPETSVPPPPADLPMC
ncbi:laccase-7-like [Prosopis cineraria]|uniref:laccase-7-like n=1 Tax=Prosopis cineraria TaxID=364024 RepID=UPI0024109ABE|nr:laccase-7-like [Prosopis cineraria]